VRDLGGRGDVFEAAVEVRRLDHERGRLLAVHEGAGGLEIEDPAGAGAVAQLDAGPSQ
jgi:hypothetical protein